MRNRTARIILSLTLLTVFFIPMSGCRSGMEPADLVLTNGLVYTMDEKLPRADALAVRGDILIAVGSDEDIAPFIDTGTQVMDLKGGVAVPGFIESHAHFMSIGRTRLKIDLKETKTWEEVIEKVRAAVENSPPDVWILGRGWHQAKWDHKPEPNVEGLPVHYKLSEVSPDNPVLLTHASGHSAIVNRKAMELAGIDRDTPDPPGGEIVRDSSGEPIGVLRETAQQLVSRVRENTWNEERSKELITLATDECLSKGITTFQDAGATFQEIDLYKKLAEEGNLRLRLWVMIGEDNESISRHLSDYPIVGIGNHYLTVRAIKRLIDGALGSHGAWLFEPYSDLPNNRGLVTTDLETMAETANLAIENGFQFCTHAIGDRAVHETLNIYETCFRDHSDSSDLRWRIEHAQHIQPDDVDRFAELGVIASMQGIHCTSDAPWVIQRLGEKRAEEGAYIWRKLLDAGTIVCNGTDAPVEDVSPIRCFYASVTRRLPDGTRFFPRQCMTREEALLSYTLHAAYAAFEENIKGSLVPGKLADITVLSKDILTVPEEEIQEVAVVVTIVGGKIRYRSGI